MNGDARSLSYSTARKVDRICDQFEAMLLEDGQPKIEEFLSQAAGAVERDSLLRGLLSIEIELLARRESVPEMDAYRRRFPEDGSAVVEVYREALKRAGISAAGRARVESEPSPRPGKRETVSLREPTGDTSCGSSQAAEDAAPELGREFGRFRILKVLGTGGFGFVYHAYDPQLDREVALKVPRAEASASPEFVERFLREARSAATLRHPNICPVYEIGEQDGQSYIVMGFIDGKPLSAFLDPTKPLKERQAALVVRKVALALEAAHQKGIIHRDLKPHNIMIDAESREPVVTDFGLARRETSDESELTQSGQVMGTPKYMPPEQAKGDLPSIGAASDVYSLGVILYELLCGRCPFTGSVGEVLGSILHQEPSPPSMHRPGLDPHLEAVCLKMMAKRPGDRYASMAEAAAVLQDWLKGVKPSAMPGSLPLIVTHDEPLSRTARRPPRPPVSPAVLWGCLGAAAAVLLGIVIIVRSPDGTETRIETDKNRATVTVAGDRIDVQTSETGQGQSRATGRIPEEHRSPSSGILDHDQQVASAETAAEERSYALQFGSRESRVDLPVTYDGSHPITLEAIVRVDEVDEFSAVPPLRAVVGCEGLDPIGIHTFPDGHIAVRFSREQPAGRKTGVADRSRESVPLGRFIHLAGVFDGERLQVFVDGIGGRGFASVSAHSSTAASPFTIGNADERIQRIRRYPYASFLGAVRMVRISSVARYERNFVPPDRFEPDEDTMALYLFHEGEGIALQDSSGNGHHGRIVGAEWVQIGDDEPPNDPSPAPASVLIENEPDRTAAEWALSLPHNPNVPPVSVRVLDATSSAVFKQFNSVKELPSGSFRVTRLDLLFSNQIRARDVERFLEPLTELAFLRLKGGDAISPAVVNVISEKKTLSSLGLFDAGRAIGDDEVAKFSSLTQLRYLAVSGSDLSDAGLKTLQNLQGLKTLWINGTRITDAGMPDLLRLPELSLVAVNDTRVGDEGVRHLVRLPALKDLQLNNCPVTDASMPEIGKVSTLEVLGLSGTQVTDEGIAHLANLKNLRILHLSRTSVTPAAAEKLRESLPALQTITVGERDDSAR